MKYVILLLLFMPQLCGAQSKAQIAQNNAVVETEKMEKFKAAWFRFATAVQDKDKATLKSLSAGCIRCSGCGGTSLSDSSEAPYSPVIPIDEFLETRLPVIFDPVATERATEFSKLAFHDDTENLDLYFEPCMNRTATYKGQKEVLILVTDPSKETEGFQLAFSFMETPEGYKFCGYSTIP
jgi:hypothetical protein